MPFSAFRCLPACVATCLSCRGRVRSQRVTQAERLTSSVTQPNIGLGKAVAPDLPYVRQDVPDDSEAPQVGGRFARLTRSGELLATSPASKGITAYLSAAHAAGMRAAADCGRLSQSRPRSLSPSSAPGRGRRTRRASGSSQAADHQDQERSQRIHRGAQQGCGRRRQGPEQAGCGKCRGSLRPGRNSRQRR